MTTQAIDLQIKTTLGKSIVCALNSYRGSTMVEKVLTSFISVSSFIPSWRGNSCSNVRLKMSHGSGVGLTMVAPKNTRRAEEIKRLTEQLEKLRTQRERLMQEKKTPSSSASTEQANKTPQASSPLAPASSQVPTSATSPSSFQPGKHSSGSRFLSVTSVEADEYLPRVLLIAGNVPGLTTEDFKKVPPMLFSKSPAIGNLFLSRLPEGFSGAFVTLPASEVLVKSGDPVAVLIDPQVFSVSKLPITPGDDVVLVVDRAIGGTEFDDRSFYAWDVNGKVEIGWADEEPPTDVAKRIGRIVYGNIEIDASLRKTKSCWEEENETYT